MFCPAQHHCVLSYIFPFESVLILLISDNPDKPKPKPLLKHQPTTFITILDHQQYPLIATSLRVLNGYWRYRLTFTICRSCIIYDIITPLNQLNVPHETRHMDILFDSPTRKMRILVATEYLPPYVSGIANRCKNLVKGYRENGHQVTVFGPTGSDADVHVPSIPNIFYNHQRMFILPPLSLVGQLLNFTQEVPYDIVHVVGPLCLAFVFLLPFFKLRGVKIYVSYHVYLEYYKNLYFGDNMILAMFLETIFIVFYFLPLVWFADTVGIPSKTADWCVFKYSKHIHYMRSGLDTKVFVPVTENHHPEDDDVQNPQPLPMPESLKLLAGKPSITTPLTRLESLEFNQNANLSSSTTTIAGPVMVYIGRLAVEKNIEFLISALSHPTLQTASLVLVGDGPIRSSLETLASTIVGAENVYSHQGPIPTKDNHETPTATGVVNGKRYRVLFAGMILSERAIAKHYATADVFVSASGSETFGFTVAEAMACGTPAVVVRSGAFKTVYRMIDGWMYEEEDQDDFAGRLGRVLKDGMMARRVARRIAVSQFSVESAILDLLKTYEWCIDGEGNGQKRLQ
jgi:glycosyltransferase involved in cell wall biosynthesis